MLVRPQTTPDPDAVRVVLDLRRAFVGEVTPHDVGDVHGFVHVGRHGERTARADAVLSRGRSLSLSAGDLPDGRPLRFEVRAERTE